MFNYDVFVEGVRSGSFRTAKDYELEVDTSKIMKGMPEKYRLFVASKNIHDQFAQSV